ncbi:hypothetical protein RvY_03997 [Ramazzottius varieornatus]|uniref:Lysosomal dipeptide transporter MFSD1 n=1 Tax=Ramazzottius varieornatus TaxID=947166 RepID=A0A1D1V032_RAMVA|nr:hypothetical protein RvY_03997 [Ramazzottius varieornatus]
MAKWEKWTVLACSCLLTFAHNFFSEITTPLSRRLEGDSTVCRVNSSHPDHCLDLSSTEYNGLTTAFFFATAVTCFFADLALKQYGQKWLLWSAGALSVIGVLIFAGGSYLENSRAAFAVLLVGRIIYGFGNGFRTAVCGHRVNKIWKDSTQIKSLFTLSARLGSAFSFLLNGGILDTIGMSNAIWIAFGLTALSAVAAWVEGYIDTKGYSDDDDEEIFGRTLWQSIKDGLWEFRKNVDKLFWFFTIAYVVIHSLITTFTANAPALLEDRGGYSERDAIWVIGIVYDMSLLIPLVGLIVDKTGHRDYWMTLGTIFIFSAFAAYLSSNQISAIAMTVFIGLGYAIFSPVSSASTSMVAPDKTEGFSEGLLNFLRYFTAGSFALVAGLILDNDKVEGITERMAWYYLIVALLVVSVVGALASLLMIYANHRSEKQPLTRDIKEHKKMKPMEDAEAGERTPLISDGDSPHSSEKRDKTLSGEKSPSSA